MRRASVSEASALDLGTNSGDKLPSTSVVDMFGRLFGVILATLLDRPTANVGKISETQNGLQSLIGDLLDRLAPSRSRSEEQSPDQVAVLETEIDNSAEERFEREERELLELKHQLWEKSGSPHELSDRSIDLILRSAPLFGGGGGDCSYHICLFRNKPVFEGLICYLAKCCGGNPHEKQLICVKGTPCDTNSAHQPQNAADLQIDSYFYSQNAPGQWMSYDFKDMRVAVTHYILRSNDNGTGGHHLRSWVIEGSEDGGKWIELDERENEGSLNGPRAIGSFEVRTVIESRFIRLRATGPSWDGSNYVYLQAFDVFGGLRVPASVKLI
jgi:hypothetical protein